MFDFHILFLLFFYFLQPVGDRLQPIKCIKVFETHFLQFLFNGFDLIGCIVVLVRVAADRDDRSAQLLIQAQDVAGRGQIVQPVLERGRIDLDPFAVRDDLFQNFFDDWLYLFKRIRAVWIIAHDHVHMGKHAVMLEGANKRKQLVVVAGIVLLLAFLILIILIPELFVVDLMGSTAGQNQAAMFHKASRTGRSYGSGSRIQVLF